MNYECDDILTTIKATSGGFRPSEPPHLQIQFNFSFKTEYLKYVTTSEEDPIVLDFLGSFPFSSDGGSATVDATGSFEAVAAAAAAAAGDLLPAGDLDDLIDRACEEVFRELPTPEILLRRRHETLDVRLDVTIQHLHVYEAEEGGGVVDCVEEEGCCICLEEIGGGGAVRMPCSHVFHGGCVEEWLRRSHCCPLCRCKMPEIEIVRVR